jgi:hypothetical protein
MELDPIRQRFNVFGLSREDDVSTRDEGGYVTEIELFEETPESIHLDPVPTNVDPSEKRDVLRHSVLPQAFRSNLTVGA